MRGREDLLRPGVSIPPARSTTSFAEISFSRNARGSTDCMLMKYSAAKASGFSREELLRTRSVSACIHAEKGSAAGAKVWLRRLRRATKTGTKPMLLLPNLLLVGFSRHGEKYQLFP